MCPTEYAIILSDKARPTQDQIIKMKELVLSGKYGFVSLHRFGAFCIDKDLIRKIGFFDERYIQGGFEDDDFMIRIREADIAVYESEEIELIAIPSSYDYSKPYIHFKEKWAFQPNKIIRMQEEFAPPDNYINSLNSRLANRSNPCFGKWIEDSTFLVNGHHNHKKYSDPVKTFITSPIHLRTVPPPIETLPHIDLIKFFARIIKPSVYVEYGVKYGLCFNEIINLTKPLCNTRCIGVTPNECHYKHEEGEYYQMLTDTFAQTVLPDLNIVIDMVFIDACHNEEQCTRDFELIFSYVADDGLIILHDTYPYNEEFTGPSFCDNAYETAWKIRVSDYYRQRCELVTIPVNPGLTIIRKSNRQLAWKAHPLTFYDIK